jgi:hypothetical protein
MSGADDPTGAMNSPANSRVSWQSPQGAAFHADAQPMGEINLPTGVRPMADHDRAPLLTAISSALVTT